MLWLLVVTGLYVLYPLDALRSVVGSLSLPDNDDSMRLVELRDLLAGQPWFDMSQHRLMPPGGASMHWSRFVDAPLAALMTLATPLFGRSLAEGLVVALWPPALFLVYLAMVYRTISARFGWRAAMLAVFTATQAGALGPLFAFGRIDHHNVQILAVTGLAICLAHEGRLWGRAALAGMLAAFSLAVGLEAVPYLAMAALVLVLDWVRTGPAALPALLGFSLALAGASLVLFAGQTSPQLWSVTACDALSPPWLWIAGCAGALAGSAALLSPRLTDPARRAALVGLTGIVTAAGFALLFPGCLRGPFHDLPPVVRQGWLDQVSEMQPFLAQLQLGLGDAIAQLAPLLVAGLVAAWTALRGPDGVRRAALLAALFLLTGAVMDLFQFRGVYMASAALAFVAGPLFDRALTLLRRPDAGWRRLAVLALALLTIARVWAAPFNFADWLAATPTSPVAGLPGCMTRDALTPLDGLAPGVILAAIDLGPPLLLQTRHAVVAAPYHRAIPGLVASVTALSGSETDLRRSLATSGVTYLALCSTALDTPSGQPVPFATRLAQGEASAPWLEPVVLAGTPLMVWRVAEPGAGSP